MKDLIDLVEQEEQEKIKAAAQKAAQCIQKDGVIHVFGCGHSHMFGEELFYRAGGLAAINPIFIEKLMLHHGAVRSSQLERKNGLAQEFMSEVDIQPNDLFIVNSTSGRNPVPIDVAEIAKNQGAFVIVITSLSYAGAQPSRHKSGKYLYQMADLWIDNHIEMGDALMEHESYPTPFGPGSTIIGMTILNAMMVEAIDIMIENHFDPPIFKSGNIDGSDEHNQKLIEKYKKRIPTLDL